MGMIHSGSGDASELAARKDELLQAMGRDIKKHPGRTPNRPTGIDSNRLSGFMAGVKHAGMKCSNCNSTELGVDADAVAILLELTTYCTKCGHRNIEIFQVEDFGIPGLPVAEPEQKFNMTAFGKEFTNFLWENRWKCRIRSIGNTMYGIMEMYDTHQDIKSSMDVNAAGNVSMAQGKRLNRKVFGRS